MTKEKKDTEKWLSLYAKNKYHAQFKIYKAYYKSMFNTCYRILKNKELAEDIMQEGFLSAFQNFNSFNKEYTLGAWLKKIMINKCLDELKRKKPELIITDKFEDIDEPEVVIDNSENINSLINKIKNAIMKLPDGYRIILSLYLIEGYDHEEIAEILNISSATSRSQYFRAKKKLKEILSKNE
ncbi:MAG: RNA polymerase sigma factor [Marinilabiliales bacterium]